MGDSFHLVDFHCHLDLYSDFKVAVHAAEAAEVYTLGVTTTPRAWPRNLELTRDKKFVRAALGLHPQLVGEFPRDVEAWDAYFDQTRYIGEVGLDASPRFYKTLSQQREIFSHVLQRCAQGVDPKVLSIHSVRSAKLVLDEIERQLPTRKHTVILHWFSGTAAELQRAIELNCYFSVNAAMLDGERRQRLVKQIPLERLLTETDGPFTTCAGRAAEPADVSATVGALATALKLMKTEMGLRVYKNLRTLLQDRQAAR